MHRRVAVMLAGLLAGSGGAAAGGVDYDLIIAGGRVVDGSGAPWQVADVGVRGDRIAAVGDLSGASAARRVDARGRYVTPGFIDLLGQSEYFLLVDPRGASKVSQGITTELTGEGDSIAPLSEAMLKLDADQWRYYGVRPDWTDLDGYARAFERARPALNLGTFVGAGGVRRHVLGDGDRPATAHELRRMEALVDQAMRQGAFGLSSSLIYVPGRFASTEELIALARVAARHGGRYATHVRNEEDRIDEALDEALRVGREAGLPVEIYHLKTAGRANWGRMPAVLERLERARAAGQDVGADQYPWTASSNSLAAELPAFMLEGGSEALLARLRDPQQRARAREEYLKGAGGGEWPEKAGRILIAGVLASEVKGAEGKTVAELAAEQGKDPFEALLDLLLADRGNTARVTFSMSEDDVRAALRHRLVAFCTDSGARAEDGVLSTQKSHPRGWASTARILGRYVRDEKLLPLEEAVRKMTSLPAQRMGLQDRGLIRAGLAADLVVFDLAAVAEGATFAQPTRYAAGFTHVAVNGQLVLDEGRLTEARPGRFLRGPGWRGSRP